MTDTQTIDRVKTPPPPQGSPEAGLPSSCPPLLNSQGVSVKGKTSLYGVDVFKSTKNEIEKSGFEKWAWKVNESGSQEERRQLLVMLKYQEEMDRQQNPLEYFVPNGKIEEVCKAIGHDQNKKIFLLSAANSLGKSAAAVVILGNIIWRSQSEWFTGERFEGKWTYPKKCWYISQSATLKDFVCGTDENAGAENSEIRKWFPKGKYTFQKNGLDYFSRLTTDNHWTVSFKTYDQDASQFESDKISVLIFDEPPPKDIYKACIARLSLGGIIIMAMTPLVNSAWVADELLPQATEEGTVFVLYADIEDNCLTHGVRGRLKHEQILWLLSQYDEDEIEARAHGKFMHLSGLVFKGLRVESHHPTIPDEQKFNQKDYRIIQVVDPHDAYPPFSVWYAVDRFLHVQAVDEYPRLSESGGQYFHQIKGFNKTTKEVCQEFKRIEGENGWDGKEILRVMDPNFGSQQKQVVGMKLHQFYAKCGREIEYPYLRYRINVNDSIEDGHALIREWLKPTPDGDVRFTITNRCPNVWYHFTHYTWKSRVGKRLELDGPGEVVAERYKAAIDDTRYLLMFLRGPKAEEIQQRPPEWYEEVYGRLDDAVANYDILDPFSVRSTN
jgi:phage terminase large subunit-like protein